MNAAETASRSFSLRALFIWFTLVAACCGVYSIAWRSNGFAWLFVADGCLFFSLFITAVALQRFWKYSLASFATMVGAYVAIYLCLTLFGRYEPAVIGLNHVKHYSWAPAGFIDDEEAHWNPWMLTIYRPLYWPDAWYWHRSVGENYPGPLPIHKHYPRW